MHQSARNLTDDVDGFLREHRYLLIDRDPLYTTAFRTTLIDAGNTIVRLPRKSQLNSPSRFRRWVVDDDDDVGTCRRGITLLMP